MEFIKDMLGRTIRVPAKPTSIVSVVPSQTELLYNLGLREEVVGITKFCVHPKAWLSSKTKIGGTKQLNLGRIKELQPDLIIANKEENTKAQIETLAKDYPVWVSDIHTLEDACEMIRQVGLLVQKAEAADTMAHTIEKGFNALPTDLPRRFAYFIWRQPWMVAGKENFIHHLLTRMGWVNVFGHKPRYPEIRLEELQAAAPEIVLLSSEPYPFKEMHIAELSAFAPHAKIMLVDGELHSWYGSRLLQSVPYFKKLSALL